MPRHKQEDNIKKNPQEVGSEVGNRMELAQYMLWWWALW